MKPLLAATLTGVLSLAAAAQCLPPPTPSAAPAGRPAQAIRVSTAVPAPPTAQGPAHLPGDPLPGSGTALALAGLALMAGIALRRRGG